MAEAPTRSDKRVLEPVERVSEVLFGLIMVLTFTGSLSVAEAGDADAGRDAVRTMLIGALGCNLAWGIIDGVFYLMGCLAERGRGLQALHALRAAADPEHGRRLLADALPPLVASVLQPSELESMRVRLQQLPEPPRHARLGRRDWFGAAGVFALVFVSTFPVAIPFLVMEQVVPAMRTSNAIAVAMLFLTGCVYARSIGRRPLPLGIGMVLLGCVLVAMTMALGG